MNQKHPKKRRIFRWAGVGIALASVLHLFVLVQKDSNHSRPFASEHKPFIDRLYHHHLLDFLAFYGRNGGEFRSGLFREEQENSESEDSFSGTDPVVETTVSKPVPIDQDDFLHIQNVLSQSMLETWFPGVLVRISPERVHPTMISEIRFDFEFLSDVFDGFGRAHLSLTKSSDGSWVMTVHHAEFPRGRRLARLLLGGNHNLLKALSDHRRNRIELEAVTNHKGLSGALGWARYPFVFAEGENDLLKRKFYDYLLRVFPAESSERIERWVQGQDLVSPTDYFKLTSVPFGQGSSNESASKTKVSRLFEKRINRHFRRYCDYPGRAFLSDPKVGVCYRAQLLVSQEFFLHS